MARPVDQKASDKVVELRDVKGLSFREIAKILDKDVKTVHRMYKRTKALA